MSKSSLKNLKFDNTFIDELPADSSDGNHRRQVHEACFSRVQPTPVEAPEVVAHSREVAELLGVPEDAHEKPEFASILAGNELADGMQTYATCYGGHQFGSWAGQLGDGRAINLGEAIGRGGKRWELQLKGAGPTPYSRRGDGRAVLRSSIREFLCSEAMHHLGVPTTRALSLVTTGESVMRDMFYDGNPAMEPGAVVCRVAPSFLRFGNFQLLASRNDVETLKILADYTIRHHFPYVGEPGPRAYRRLFEEVCHLTAEMVAHWMSVGFVHGVMNTDNMSILGLTIDYGPYGWLEDYDPDWTPNTSDAQTGRYRFGHQPAVAQWNLAQLGIALGPLIGDMTPVEETLSVYQEHFEDSLQANIADKLGLDEYIPATDDKLVEELFSTLSLTETDMTIFFRRLADVTVDEELNDDDLIAPLVDAYYFPIEMEEHIAEIASWIRRYAKRVHRDALSTAERRTRMNGANPKYVLRNYLAQLAIDASENGDHSKTRELLDVMRNPFDEQPGREEYARRRPEWARNRAGCSQLSCSS